MDDFRLSLKDFIFMLIVETLVLTPNGDTRSFLHAFEQAYPFPTEIARDSIAYRGFGNVDAVVEMKGLSTLVFPYVELVTGFMSLRQPRLKSVDEVVAVLSNSPFAPLAVTWDSGSEEEVMGRIGVELVQRSSSTDYPSSGIASELCAPMRLSIAIYPSGFEFGTNVKGGAFVWIGRNDFFNL